MSKDLVSPDTMEAFLKVHPEWVAQGDIIGLPDHLTVSGGMSFELPFNHGFDLTCRHRVTVRVELAIYDGATRVPVSLYAP